MRLAMVAIAAAFLASLPDPAGAFDLNSHTGKCESNPSLEPQGECIGYTLVAVSGNFGPQTLALINSYRTSRGLSPLTSNGTLVALARQHSQYQSARNRMSHDGFRQRSARAKAAGLSIVCAENVAYNYKSAQHLLSGWVRSAGHRKNLLRPGLRYAGVSIVGDYATFFACQ